MPIEIVMKGALEPIVLEESFADALNSLQMSAAQGREFIVGTMPSGQAVGISMRNILSFGELDDDHEPLIGAGN